MSVARFVVTGEQNGVPVKTVYRNKKAAIKFAYTLSNAEVYDNVNRDYVYGTSKFYMALKADSAKPTL